MKRRWVAVGLLGCAAAFLPLTVRAAPSFTLQPDDFVYRGAFRLPEGGERPLTFEYGGNAMTVNLDGDSSGADDGFPGSLFIMGHERMPYGELPDGNQVAEVTIPAPVVARSVDALPQAAFIQDFADITAGMFASLDEIPRVGMQYLDTPATGPKLHIAWGQHFQDDPATQVASHAWVDLTPDAPHLLDAPHLQGPWFIDDQSLYSVNGYLLDIPADWADQYVQGRLLGTGRYRDGGWSGMGPALFAYRPWLDDAGTPAPAQSRLEATTLLLYASSADTDRIERALTGYQHPDAWEGAAWITTGDGESAVVFAGTKGTGAKYWYGFVNPAGPEYPCVEGELVGQYDLCRWADGTPCPPEDLVECEDHTSGRGWWSSSYAAQMILYDPADLAQVAAGQLEPWEPQPYAVLSLDPVLFLPPSIDPDMTGVGVQRHSRIGDITYDRAHHMLYVLELFADDARPVVHVWQVGP